MSSILFNRAGWLIAGLLFGISSTAVAQQVPALRIGFTDHEILISNMPEYRQVQQQLQSEIEKSESELQQLVTDLEAMAERYQKQLPLMGEESRQRREEEIRSEQQAIQRRAEEAQENIALLEAELLSPIFERVDVAIKKISEEKSLDLVLRIQAGPAQPIILFANEERIVDITRDVALELGIDVDEEEDSDN